MRKATLKIIVYLCCSIMVIVPFNSSSLAAGSNKDYLQVDSITIEDRNGIVEGKKTQLKAIISPENTLASAVEWSSSNPSVISCTKDGVISGVSAGGYADISCKAKYGDVEDTIRIYCAESIGYSVKSDFKEYFNFIYSAPSQISVAYVNFNYVRLLTDFFVIIAPFLRYYPLPVSETNAIGFFSGKCTIEGKYDSFAYITFFQGETERDGFIRYSRLEQTGGAFLDISPKDINVWGDGITYDGKKLSSSYKGEIEWYVADDTIAHFDDVTMQVTGLKPGRTTITATASGMSVACTVHSLYKWPQTWSTKTNCDTNLYLAEGSGYKISKTMQEGMSFTVYGDDGSSDGWAYGKIDGTDTWGYVPISHISTKGTISQYNNLKTTLQNDETISWIWPVRDVKNGINQSVKARYITSPYGWRDTDPARHKGVDITNGVSSNLDFANSVDGYEVVSAFAGKVIYVYDISSGYKSCGNCVAIRSNEKDPITGKYYVAIYMHLKSKPSVRENQNISANTLLGYVGNTGNSGGSHLHFEVNNQNLSYGQKIYYENNSDKEMVFGSVINPLFFYMDYYYLPDNNPEKITINKTCAAMNYRKPLWYGDDIKESKKP